MMKKILLQLVVSLLLASSFSVSAAQQNSAPLEEKPRWFEVEVIVYKPTNNQGLLDESWDKETALSPASPLVDFLQPFYLEQPDLETSGTENQQLDEFGLPIINTDCIAEENKTVSEDCINTQTAINPDNAIDPNTITLNQANLTSENIETTVPELSPIDTSIIDINSLDEEALLLQQLNPVIEEKPFVLLNDEDLQLNNEVSSLNRHPDYKVLTHIAWRQPVLGKNKAPSIRIAGGQDFSLNYDYQGNKILTEEIESEPGLDSETDQTGSLLATDDNSLQNTSEHNSIDLQQNELLENETSNTQSDTQESSFLQTQTDSDDTAITVENDTHPLLPQIIPMLWVPELDGDIQIYLNRFLHIKTNLFIRKEGKEEIEAIDLDLYSPEMLSVFSTDSEQFAPSASSGDVSQEFVLSDPFASSQSNKISDENDNIFNSQQRVDQQPLLQEDASSQSQADQQFTWEIGDDFLETESQKMYIQRLFNYSVKQSRRVRSGELHYFDHPLVGLLIIIRPYELATEETEEELINNQAISNQITR